MIERYTDVTRETRTLEIPYASQQSVATEFIRLVVELFHEIPEQYRNEAQVDIMQMVDVDGINDGTMISFYWDSPETDEEFEQRKQRIEKMQAYAKQDRYKEYLKLKEEFEGGNGEGKIS